MLRCQAQQERTITDATTNNRKKPHDPCNTRDGRYASTRRVLACTTRSFVDYHEKKTGRRTNVFLPTAEEAFLA